MECSRGAFLSLEDARNDGTQGVVLLSRLRVVERTFISFCLNRRLNKDYEKLERNRKSVCYFAMFRIMVNCFTNSF